MAARPNPNADSAVPDTLNRLRRLRRTPVLRTMVQETVVRVENLVLPLFVSATVKGRREIVSMPGFAQTDVDELLRDIEEAANLGLKAVILFGIPRKKDARGSDSFDDRNGIIQTAARAVKKRFGDDMVLISDACFCEYTDHGHCGVLDAHGRVDNDKTLELLQLQVISHVKAGVDVVAPSGMMDGAVLAIRTALDNAGFAHTPILAYAAKFASALYGPFRDAADSAPKSGAADRKGYQMNPANSREALLELQLDDSEGADILMVKPASLYLDLIARARENFQRPIAAYNVSGEYAMVHAAAKAGWLDYDATMLEMLTSIKRAGADLIITYFARDFARKLKAAVPSTPSLAVNGPVNKP